MIKRIFQRIEDEFGETVRIRRYLHQHPELSFKEYKTAAFIADYYESLNIPYVENVGGNGIIATLQGKKTGKTIAFRADFDGLPIQDEKNVPYRSKVDGVMHACGHDGHTALLLVLARILKDYQNELPGTVVFIHQHAEEVAPGGAKPMIEAGALDDVDAIFGTHLWAVTPYGVIETSKSTLMAGADRFTIQVQGKGGHGAAPHETKDAIVIGAEIVTQLQQIVSRRIDPIETAVVTVGKFQAGQSFNIIADKAEIVGTTRYLNTSIQKQVQEMMEMIVKGICATYDAEYTINYEVGYPPLINHAKEAEIVLSASRKVPNIKQVKEVVPVMGSEDFAYYLLNKPGAFFFTGAQKEGHRYPHHHPKFDFDERAMMNAQKVLFQAFIDYQQQAL